ncbi:putative solute-binding protein [Alkanindiges sp. WGS2144]|uniref:putative solute-binding protein n=1 Tax=Alkanindiges sp. WGS2144 TaxID=3366808 RepID=UPI003750C2D6
MRKKGHSSVRSLVLLSGVLGFIASAQAQTICAFDLGGASGDNFALMKDYVLAAKKWNVDITLKAYGDEGAALRDFKAGQCDGLVATSFVTREFNSYTGSINAIGAVPSNVVARNVLMLMGNPKAAGDMVEGEYEAAGIIPIGSAYFVTKDRNINTLAKIEGKRIGVLEVDPVQRRMAQKVGAKPVLMTIDNAGQKFQAGQVDILPAPSMAYIPLEVYRSMGASGGIARFPLSFMSLNLVLKKNAYPAGFGQKSRSWFSAQTPRLMNKVSRDDGSVPAKYWFDIPSEDQVGYLRLLRQMRIEFVQNKTYNPKMMSLLKKLRCQQDPSNYECKLKGE